MSAVSHCGAFHAQGLTHPPPCQPLEGSLKNSRHAPSEIPLLAPRCPQADTAHEAPPLTLRPPSPKPPPARLAFFCSSHAPPSTAETLHTLPTAPHLADSHGRLRPHGPSSWKPLLPCGRRTLCELFLIRVPGTVVSLEPFTVCLPLSTVTSTGAGTGSGCSPDPSPPPGMAMPR